MHTRTAALLGRRSPKKEPTVKNTRISSIHRIYTVYALYVSPYPESMDTVDLRFARTLKALRHAKGLTQESLAHRSGVDYKYLQKLEGNNPSSPTLATMEKLASGLDVPLLELVRHFVEESR